MDLASIGSIAGGLRPRATAGTSDVAPLVMSGVILVAMLGLIVLAVFLVRAKDRQTHAIVTRALSPLGLTARRRGLRGWQSSGAVSGRPFSIVIAPEQRYTPSSLSIEIASGARFEASVGPSVAAAAEWLRSAISGGVEVPVAGFPPRSVHSDSPPRAHALAQARLAGIQRMLAPLVAGQQRWLFVKRGHVTLRVLGEAWQTLTPESLRADIDELAAIATMAERA